MSSIDNIREADLHAATMCFSFVDSKLRPACRLGLPAPLFGIGDAVLRRASGMDTLMRLISVPSGATVAALVIGAIFRSLKLTN